MPAATSNNKIELGPLGPDTLRIYCAIRRTSVTKLARKFGCTRQAIYFAVEKPDRYTRVYRQIREALL